MIGKTSTLKISGSLLSDVVGLTSPHVVSGFAHSTVMKATSLNKMSCVLHIVERLKAPKKGM